MRKSSGVLKQRGAQGGLFLFSKISVAAGRWDRRLGGGIIATWHVEKAASGLCCGTVYYNGLVHFVLQLYVVGSSSVTAPHTQPVR